MSVSYLKRTSALKLALFRPAQNSQASPSLPEIYRRCASDLSPIPLRRADFAQRVACLPILPSHDPELTLPKLHRASISGFRRTRFAVQRASDPI